MIGIRHAVRVAALAAVLVAAAAGLGLAVAQTSVGAAPPMPRASTEDPTGPRVIVKYRALATLKAATAIGAVAASGPRHAAELSRRHGLALRDGHAIDHHSQVLHGAAGMTSATLAARLAADPDVEWAVPDLRRALASVPNDPLYAANAGNALAAGQWYLRPPDATFISAINAQGAWDLSTGSAKVVIADIDTGALYGHPDLAAMLLPGRSFVSSNGSTGQGWSADASDPGDWTTGGQCGRGVAATPSSWHGTQTASLMGAQTNNGSGMASVGYNIRIQPVRALGPCGGYDSDIIAAMYWAGGLADPTTGDPSVPANPSPARVINMSLGAAGTCNAAYSDAVNALVAAGVVVVAAAGNDEGLAVGVPGNCPGVIAVAGLRNVGTKVGFSSIGPEVSIAAPAGNCVNTTGTCLYPILAATNSGTTSPVASGQTYTDSSNTSLGTSFSSPLVAATAALMLSVNPALTPAQLRTLLQGSARSFPTNSAGATTSVAQCRVPTATSAAQDECICTTSTCGAGMLDAAAALLAATSGARPTVTVTASAPTVTRGSIVSFVATATAPASRVITGYLWSISSGNAIATLTGATNTPTASVATRGAGSFTLTLTVTDGSGAMATASSTVSVNPPAAPTASIAAAASVVLAGNTITLDGSGSSVQAPTSIVAYQWSITAGGKLAAFSSAIDGATAQLASDARSSGSVAVQLTVTDSLGRQASTQATLSIVAAVPTAAISTPSGTVAVGSSVVLDGSGSMATAGRTISAYQWAISSGTALASINGNATGATVTLLAAAPGTVTVQLTVTDSAGVQAMQSSTLVVAAAPTGAPASASTSGAGGGALGGGGLLGLAAACALLAWYKPVRRGWPDVGPDRLDQRRLLTRRKVLRRRPLVAASGCGASQGAADDSAVQAASPAPKSWAQCSTNGE